MAKKTNGLLDGDSAASLARVMQIVGMPLLLGLSGWMFTTLNDVATRVVRLEEKVQVAADDRYRASQAMSDFKLRDAQINLLMERIQSNEQRSMTSGQRMSTLEDRLNRVELRTAPPR